MMHDPGDVDSRRSPAPRPTQGTTADAQRRAFLIALSAAATAARPGAATAQSGVPSRYPPRYAAMVASAMREGSVVVDSTTDAAVAAPLIDDFNALYPDIAVRYREAGSADMHRRFLAEAADGRDRADVLWSSAMDLQVKLVNDGQALRYASPEAQQLPPWAVWRHEAYGTTVEPVGFAYDRRRLAAHEVPRTRRDFARLVESDPQRFRARVVTYDIERSGLGFLFATQDARTSGLLWEVARALGAAQARGAATSAAMLQSLASGESLLAYNVLGTYALARMRDDPAIGFVQPQDYTLVASRIAFISRHATHPNAARLWLDHLLSRRGQGVLANRSGLYSLRSDVDLEPAAGASKFDAGARPKPIVIGPSLMVYLDRSKREDFLRQWKRAMAGS